MSPKLFKLVTEDTFKEPNWYFLGSILGLLYSCNINQQRLTTENLRKKEEIRRNKSKVIGHKVNTSKTKYLINEHSERK